MRRRRPHPTPEHDISSVRGAIEQLRVLATELNRLSEQLDRSTDAAELAVQGGDDGDTG